MYGLTGHFPDVVWDGYVDTRLLVKGVLPPEQRICVQKNAEVLNADGPNKYKNPSKDAAPFRCELAKLPPVSIVQLAAQS
jgi:hypothetical protein